MHHFSTSLQVSKSRQTSSSHSLGLCFYYAALHWVLVRVYMFPFLGTSTTWMCVLCVGYIVSAVAANAAIALALGPVTVIPMMLFGGLLVNIDSM